MEIFIGLICLILDICVGVYASKKGRSGIGWFFFSLFLSFLIGFIVVACLGETEEKRMERIYAEEATRRSVLRELENKDKTPAAPTPKAVDSGKVQTINDKYRAQMYK